jgi:hypothetical protein
MKHSLANLIILSLILSACAAPAASVAPATTAPVIPTATASPTDTPAPTPTAEPTATPDPFAGVNYASTIELSQDLGGGAMVAAVDENGQLAALWDGDTLIQANEAGFYVFDNTPYTWNKEGKLVEVFVINGGNLRRWDAELGDYKGVRKNNEQLKAHELLASEEGLGLAAVDKDGGLILWIEMSGQLQYPSDEGLLNLGGHFYYWRTETQELQEIVPSTADVTTVAEELGLTHEDGQQFMITIGKNNNDGEWYNYVTLAGENPEDQGARLARLNPDGTWTKLSYETQEGKEEMFGHLVPLGENAIVSYGDFDFFHNHGETGMEILDLQGYNTGLRASYTLDNLARYTAETVEVEGPLVAMRDRKGRVLLGLSPFTSPQLKAFYQNDYLRVSDEPKRGGYYVSGAAEDLWKLITPGIKVFTRMYSKLPAKLGYYDHIFTIDGKEVGSQYDWMMYQTYRQYQGQVDSLVALLKSGEEVTDEIPWYIMPRKAELVIAPDK